jgi:hypothetical protein
MGKWDVKRSVYDTGTGQFVRCLLGQWLYAASPATPEFLNRLDAKIRHPAENPSSFPEKPHKAGINPCAQGRAFLLPQIGNRLIQPRVARHELARV